MPDPQPVTSAKPLSISRRLARQTAVKVVFSALSRQEPAAECLNGVAQVLAAETAAAVAHAAQLATVATTADIATAAESATVASQTAHPPTDPPAVMQLKRQQQALDDELAQAIIRVFDYRRSDIDHWISGSYQRQLAHLSMLEHAVIATAIAEMLARPDTPAAVIINEAVMLTKIFGAEGGSALVNGMLDTIATQHKLRSPA